MTDRQQGSSNKRAARLTKLYMQSHAGCRQVLGRDVSSTRAKRLRIQRRTRLRWHLDQIARLLMAGPYALLIKHAYAGELLARNLGDLNATLECMLSRGKAYWCIGWDLDSACLMESAIKLTSNQHVKPTSALMDTAIELYYRLASIMAKREHFPKADYFLDHACQMLAHYVRIGGDLQRAAWHEANISWVSGLRLYLTRGTHTCDSLAEVANLYAQADAIYARLPVEQNTARLKYEMADIELDRAEIHMASDAPDEAAAHFQHAARLLDASVLLLANNPWDVVRAMLPVVSRRLALLSGSQLPADISELLVISEAAHEHNDPLVRSRALMQACHEVMSELNLDDDESLAAVVLIALEKSCNSAIPDSLRRQRTIAQSNLVPITVMLNRVRHAESLSARH